MNFKTKFTEGEKGEKIKTMPLKEFIEEIYGQFAFFYLEKLEWYLEERAKFRASKESKYIRIEDYSNEVINSLWDQIKETKGKKISFSVYLLLENQFILLDQNRLDGLKGFEKLITELFYYDPEEGILYFVK